MSDHENWYKAVHEAAHAVLGLLFERKIISCTIEPGDHSDGMTRQALPDGDDRDVVMLFEEDLSFLIDQMTISIAGTVAETRAVGYNAPGFGIHPDADPDGTHQLVPGTDADTVFSLAAKQAFDGEEITALVDWVRLRARRLIDWHWDAIERIAEALIERTTLDGKEVGELFQQAESTEVLTDATTFIDMDGSEKPYEETVEL